MSNKKGGVPAEQIVAIVIVIVLATIMALMLTTCKAYKEFKDYNNYKMVRMQLEVAKSFYTFIQTPIDDEREVLDLIIESIDNDDFSEFDTIVNDYFGEYNDPQKLYPYWQFIVDDTSQADWDYHSYYYGTGIVSTLQIPLFVNCEVFRDYGIEISRVNANLEITDFYMVLTFGGNKCTFT